jgi:CRP/FNR family transcriptional regulator, nitrogen oxide reductase regulator
MKIPQRSPVFPPPLLAGLSDADSKAIMDDAACQSFPARTVVCRQGEPAQFLFLVQAGRVRFARTTREGHDVLLRWLGPGECFGLGSLLSDPLKYMATGLTLDDTTLYAWAAGKAQTAAATYPRLGQNTLRIALLYLDEFGARHAALLSRTAEQRVARTLTHLGATHGRVLATGVELEITNQELASFSDVGMFTVSRQMKRWEREGHLIKQRQRVIIRHPEGLLDP